MNPDSRDEAEALGRYREALAAGAPEPELARLETGLDPELAAAVRWSMTRARQARPQPDPAFVRDLRRELVQAASARAAVPSPGPAASAPTIADGNDAQPPLVPFPRQHGEPPTIMQPRWGWPWLAAAAVLVFVIAGGLLQLRPQPSQQQLASPPYVARFAPLWASTGGPEPLAHPVGVAVDPRGNIWVTDGQRDRFQILAPDGTFLESWGESGTENGQFEFRSDSGNPMYDYGDIAFAPDGSFYVADTGNHRVQQFSPDRSFVGAWGSTGNQQGQFVTPGGVAVGPDGAVYVSDEHRGDIQKFSADGQWVTTIGQYGQDPGQLRAPGGLAVDAAGDIWVADSLNNRVQRFNTDGTFVSVVGRQGVGEGEFNRPNDVAVDADGRLYVADMGNDAVQVFGQDGRFLATTGRQGGPLDNLAYPMAVAVAPNGVVYVTDTQRVRALELLLAIGDR